MEATSSTRLSQRIARISGKWEEHLHLSGKIFNFSNLNNPPHPLSPTDYTSLI
jgi:hypothetical protein